MGVPGGLYYFEKRNETKPGKKEQNGNIVTAR